MKHKWIIISLAVLFFLTALTFYANRVIFPTVIKKIAVEQAQNFLKRKVEIESLHFNWLKGVVIKNIKIFQKGSSQEVFVQAEKVSIKVIFIPGTKQHKLIFPSITVESPSLYLIHTSNDQWNFSDLLAAPAASGKPSPVAVSLGGITIVNGKARLDDISPQGIGTEMITPVNLKVGLSYQGISFDGSLTLPQKQGLIAVNGNYWPLNQSLKATVNLKNIKPLDYLSLVPVKLPLTLASATINEVSARVDYEPEKIDVQGKWSIKNIDATYEKHIIKTDIDASNAHILVSKTTSVKGAFSLANVNIQTPSFSMTGALNADIEDFLMNSPQDISFKGAVQTGNINVQLSNDQSFQGQVSAKITNAVWKKDTAAFEGNLGINQAMIALDDERNIKGDLKLNAVKISKDTNSISAQADLNVANADIRLPGEIFKGNLNAPHWMVNLDGQNNIKADGHLDLTDMEILTGKSSATGELHLKSLKIAFDQNAQDLEIHSQGTLQDANLKLENQEKLETNAHFDINVTYPLRNPDRLQYSGSVAVSDTRFEGLPVGPLNDIHLTADIKTDQADIQNLSLTVLETPIKASGRIINFSKPMMNVEVESQQLDLSKIKEVAPDILSTYGLTVDGTASFQLKFEGLASDPLSGKINAQAVLKSVNVESSTLKQAFKGISGTVNADGNSLSWDGFTVTVMDHILTSKGRLTDFKNPNVNTSLSWQGLELTAQINKNANVVDIKSISGHYLSAPFNANGSIDLSGKTPRLNIKSSVKFKLEDLVNLVPSLKSSLEPLKLSGPVDVTSSLQGPASDWKSWVLTAEAQSGLATIAGFKFNNLNVDLGQDEGKIKKFNITSTLYDGNLNIVTTADLNNPTIPFETALHVENVNLAKLKNDTGAKDEDLRGYIALTSVVNGDVTKILNIKGNGALNITQGYLMKKEFSSLFMIPELSNLIFTDATANFTIADQKVSTQNFALKSDGATLNGIGWIGFDHKLQFELHPEFNTDTIAQSDSLRKGPSALIALAAGKYFTFTIDGTLEKPVVHTIKKPTELIKKTGEILKDNVGQILQGFFQ